MPLVGGELARAAFEHGRESYGLAQTVLEKLTEVLRAAGIGSPEQVDLWTALFTGLASQQISNDPGGDRWHRLIDDAVTLLTEPRSTVPLS